MVNYDGIERKRKIKPANMLITLSFLLIILFLVTLSFVSAYGIFRCENDNNILANESEGQIILDNLAVELRNELNRLNVENPNLTIEDKINFTNKKVYYYVPWINETTAQPKRCYTEFFTKETDDWPNSYPCLRKTSEASANFTALHKCGACEEYARLNRYLLESIGIKTRVIATMSRDHVWNEVKINGMWIQNDATSSNFFFNDTRFYEETAHNDLYWVRVIEGEGKGEDLTSKYNKDLSVKDITKRIINKPFILLRDYFLDKMRNHL